MTHQSYKMYTKCTAHSNFARFNTNPFDLVWFHILDTPFGMAVPSPSYNDSVVYLHKGECRIPQNKTDENLGLPEREEIDKTSPVINLSAIAGAPPNQQVNNIWKRDSKYSKIQPAGATIHKGAKGATDTSTEILSRTGTILNMQPALESVK